MRHVWRAVTMTLVLQLLAHAAGAVPPPAGRLGHCAADAVVSGSGCMDRYEASVWRVPSPAGNNAALVGSIRRGTATVALLTAGGATLLGVSASDYAPCLASGQNCADDIYAVSLPGVRPSANITWFQAQQACTNAGKRLPTSAEWQAAVAGTPDPGPDNGTTDCNTRSFSSTLTGQRSSCVSSCGAFDMVGNLFEWVADWMPRSNSTLGGWNAGISPTHDLQQLAGAATSGEPGALARGGFFASSTNAGPLQVDGLLRPTFTFGGLGFRCAR